MPKNDYSKVMEFFALCMSANSMYHRIAQETGDPQAERVKAAFAAAISAISDTTRILEGDVDPETAYYNIYRTIIGELTPFDSNEVVEATMKMYFPFEYDEEPHELEL